ncbi:MAG: hypothetical protein SX243_15175 [Acidobacteriota bacterium]|nr:hypothetical protein [Acidobacteriota bacterium]
MDTQAYTTHTESNRENNSPRAVDGKSIRSYGVAVGLLCTVLIAILCTFLGKSEAKKNYSTSQRTKKGPPALAGSSCNEEHLYRINTTYCRPKDPIDLYIIEDHSFSSKEARRRLLVDEIRTIASQDPEIADLIACTGFASSVMPETFQPAPNDAEGCLARLKEAKKYRSEETNRHFYETTDFEKLFSSLEQRITQERQFDSGTPQLDRRHRKHRDIIVIISDGIHHLESSAKDCVRAGEVAPEEVFRSFRSLKTSLLQHQAETWAFLVILDPQEGCVADIETYWQSLINIGLITIQAPRPKAIETITQEILQIVNSHRYSISAAGTEPRIAHRLALDFRSTVEITFNVRRFGQLPFEPLRSPDLPIRMATLGEEGGSTIVPLTHKVSHREQRVHQSRQFISTRNPTSTISFHNDANMELDPKKTYFIQLDIDGVCTSQKVPLPPHWRPLAISALKRLHNTLWNPLVFLLAIFVLARLLLAITQKQAAPTVALTLIFTEVFLISLFNSGSIAIYIMSEGSSPPLFELLSKGATVLVAFIPGWNTDSSAELS